MRWFRKHGKVCQNCAFGNNEKGKWKKTLFYYTGIIDDNGKKDKRHWHIFCEKKQKYYAWDKYKRCFRTNKIPHAIEIETIGKTVNLTLNKKMIVKGGKIKIDYTNEIPNISLFDWSIGYKRKRRFLFFRNKMGNGISIKGDSLIISGESKQEIELVNTSKPYMTDKNSITLKDGKQLNWEQSVLKNAENIINQFRGYFQAEEDELIKDNSMRMLDELEMIIKS